MSMSRREVIAVTSAADPQSIIAALREVPVGAFVTGLETGDIETWDGKAWTRTAVLTFERPVNV